jgi:hypothetical protein
MEELHAPVLTKKQLITAEVNSNPKNVPRTKLLLFMTKFVRQNFHHILAITSQRGNKTNKKNSPRITCPCLAL